MYYEYDENVIKNSKEISVIIIGGVHHNTLGVVRSIGDSPIDRKKIYLLLVGKDAKEKDFISKSKYIKSKNVIYAKDDNEIVDLINKNKIEKSVIICCSDGSAEKIMKNRERLEDYLCPKTEMDINILLDKQKQSEIALKANMSIPRSYELKTAEFKEEKWNIFPCIIKPIKSILGGGKEDIKIAHSLKELIKNLVECSADTVQIQEYIDKQMEFQLIGCSLEAGKIIIIPGYTEIIRQQPNTNTGYLKYSPINGLDIQVEKIEDLIRTFGYSGLFSMEFIRDNNNQDFYLETNFRNDGNAFCVKDAGVNLPFIWCYYNYYGELPKGFKTELNKSVMFTPDLEDFKLGIKEIGLIKWIIQFLNAESHAVFSKRDLKPFIVQIKKRIINKCFKKSQSM